MRDTLKTIALAACLTFVVAAAALQTGCASDSRSAGRTLDDATLTASVKTELLGDPLVEGTDINVDTYRGVVQLNGFVDSQEQKQAAERIARSVQGVASVQNNLQIKPEAAGASPNK